MSCLDECGLSHLPRLFLDLAIMRLIEPASKRRSIELLDYYFGIKYSQRIYRNIPKFIDHKVGIEQCAYNVAQTKFNEPFYFVLYDVTTLYFESFKADEFKSQGFSKDNKSQQPQIVIGLLVTQSGFPLISEVFAGNTFEGKTMLPIVEKFISEHPHSNPIIVADAAMLDEERLTELNTSLIEKRTLLLGIKGYCTNLLEEKLSSASIIDRYHQLWHVEQAFRMSKFDLQTRPIYHQNHDAIKAHVLICFVALMAEKYLELTTKLSLRETRFLIWNITETHIQDNLTKEVFVFRSPMNDVLKSKLAGLISEWNLLPH